ncbi:MAG: hypothetical protein AAGI23_09195 [Bacteroidota bacterium]
MLDPNYSQIVRNKVEQLPSIFNKSISTYYDDKVIWTYNSRIDEHKKYKGKSHNWRLTIFLLLFGFVFLAGIGFSMYDNGMLSENRSFNYWYIVPILFVIIVIGTIITQPFGRQFEHIMVNGAQRLWLKNATSSINNNNKPSSWIGGLLVLGVLVAFCVFGMKFFLGSRFPTQNWVDAVKDEPVFFIVLSLFALVITGGFVYNLALLFTQKSKFGNVKIALDRAHYELGDTVHMNIVTDKSVPNDLQALLLNVIVDKRIVESSSETREERQLEILHLDHYPQMMGKGFTFAIPPQKARGTTFDHEPNVYWLVALASPSSKAFKYYHFVLPIFE